MKFNTKIIDHLGIVSGVCDDIGLVAEIDSMLGVNPLQKVTTGESVKMMVLNALGFVSKPLYMYPEYVENKAMPLFFRADLSPEDFNDDTIGRALDRLYNNDPTNIFMKVAMNVTTNADLQRKFFHLDTTSISVHGEYASKDMDQVPILITHGHSKDGRPDLKQFCISLINSTEANLPVWVAALDGNTSDTKHFADVIRRFAAMLRNNNGPVYFVMDSAWYSEDNIKDISSSVLWISRIPEKLTLARKLLVATPIASMFPCQKAGYRFKEHIVSYGGIEQKWVVVYSKEAHARERKTLDKNVQNERTRIEKSLWHFGNREFKCQEDAMTALVKMEAAWKYHKVKDTQLVSKRRSKKRGRPKKDAANVRPVYFVKATIDKDQEKTASAEGKIGKFIVGTNDMTMNGEEALAEYKNQQGVERGFRFIKDPMFFASSVFLKSPRRIVSLVMVMALGLLVYSLAQYKLRKALVEYKQTVLNQKRKPTERPTMRWIFQKFEGIHLLEYVENGQHIIKVLNLKDEHVKIIRLLGPAYEKSYLLA